MKVTAAAKVIDVAPDTGLDLIYVWAILRLTWVSPAQKVEEETVVV